MMPSRARTVVCVIVLIASAALPARAHDTPPTAPAEIFGLPASTSSVMLFWKDTANNESRYLVEQRALGGQFVEVQSLPPNSTGTTVGGLAAGTLYEFRVGTSNDAGSSPYSNIVPLFTDQVVAPGTCAPTPFFLCLDNGRFRVEATWETATNAGNGTGQALNSNSGSFWFFDSDNTELILKVLNGCGVNDSYWVFASGLTNVEVQITVIDTQVGRTRRYFNPQGKAFAPIQDTSAFATCP